MAMCEGRGAIVNGAGRGIGREHAQMHGDDAFGPRRPGETI